MSGLRFERLAVGSHAGDTVSPASRLLRPQPGLTTASPRLLHPRAMVHERWLGPGDALVPVHEGCLSYAIDGPLLFGTAVLDDARHAGGLRGAATQIYRELFELLACTGRPYLWRVWNYMACINEVAAGLERYRQFNVGRQEAFLEAERSAFVGAPAACALGTSHGPLTVHFIAGRQQPEAVENPRQVSAYHYPSAYGPSAPTFSRAALVDLGAGREALFISGTASIVGHDTRHAGDVRRQTEETLDNIDAVVTRAVAGSALSGPHAHDMSRLDYTAYVRHEADLAQVRDTLERRLGNVPAANRAVYLRADVCRSDLLVEIEAQHIGGCPLPSARTVR